MSWKRTGAAILSIFVVLSAAPASASISQAGRVNNLIVNHAGRFFFNHDGQRDVKPSCAVYQRWVIDATTPAGQAMMSLVLTSQAQGKSIVVMGSGDCSDWSDTEAVNFLLVVN